MTMLDLARKRRSCYALTNKIPLTEQQLFCLVREAVKQAPSAFNSQSARVMVLLAEKHHLFWQLVLGELKKIVPPEHFIQTEEKISSFDRAFGTLLFFEDIPTIQALQRRFAIYKDNFPIWAYQSNGMLEYLIWAALAEQNIGASLQHYNPLIDKAAGKVFGIPKGWELIAQMPFGVQETPVQNKTFLPVDNRVIIK
ncbi:MAG: nitroreductase family protein [Elusimicrobiaceae bacterium]|nr:nitroreductase family protein [Elusimicrobiaceae bacterium]